MGSPGMAGASARFSWKPTMCPSRAISMTPNSVASRRSTGMAATVTSARFCSWYSTMLLMFMR